MPKSLPTLTEGEVKHERTGAVAPPSFPYTHGVAPEAIASRRERLAAWVTAPSNPYFAKSFVNRMWSYLTGVGIIEPVDDIRAGNPPTNPELLDRLTKDFVESKFDVRKLVRSICQSRTYQLSIVTNEWNADDEANYAHATARRLPAEVLYDTVHAAAGVTSKLPGLAPGSRASQLIDSTADLPGGFLDLFGKPARESACECERSNGMMLGPVLAMVSGPVIGDAVQDATGRLARMTVAEKDDRKVVTEIYLSVMNRFPTNAELEEGVHALSATVADHGKLTDEFNARKAAFESYAKTLDAKQTAWEVEMKNQKPTTWTVAGVQNAVSKLGQNPGASKVGSTLTGLKDGSILVSGKNDVADLVTVTTRIDLDGPITAVRLEALTDSSLPGKGPGRAGNFVLSEFKANAKAVSGTGDAAKPKALKFVRPEATFSQDGFPVANAIDNNNATGWAVFPQAGRDHAALFRVQQGPNAKDGILVTFTLEQRYGQNHTLGRFRISATADKAPRLTSPISPELLMLLDQPVAKRTDAQRKDLRARYLAQDVEYQKLNAAIAVPPPTDARVLGTQDLVWALLNSPGFLFNR